MQAANPTSTDHEELVQAVEEEVEEVAAAVETEAEKEQREALERL